MDTKNITQVFGITPDELKEDILTDLREELKSIAQKFQPPKQEEYLSRKEVAAIFKVSLPTIHDWNKKKILNPLRVGNLIRYRRSDIDKALVQINFYDTG